LFPERRQKEDRRNVPSTTVIGRYGHPDRQWRFNYISKGIALSIKALRLVGKVFCLLFPSNDEFTGRDSAPVK
jgi:hypothetical protein